MSDNNTDLKKFISNKSTEKEERTAMDKTDCDSSDLNKCYNLEINSDFLDKFNLYRFLEEYVLKDSFQLAGNEKENITITNYDDLRHLILRKWQAKKYIGVGVGGVFIKSDINKNNKKNKKKEYVLLYKRYHDPEDQQWSILGGSSKFGCNIEDTLKDKIAAITNVSRDTIIVKDIIKENNHLPGRGEPFFHYLSPSYYVEIESINNTLTWVGDKKSLQNKNGNKKQKSEKKYVHIIDSVEDFSQVEISKQDNIPLAWVAVDIINNDAVDTEGDPIFAFTTLGAIKRHRIIQATTKNMIKQLESAKEQIRSTSSTVKGYMDWRIKNDI